MSNILITEESRAVAEAIGLRDEQAEQDYLEKKNSFLSRIRNHVRSVRAKYAWLAKRQHFMQGIRKHFNSTAYDRRKCDLRDTLKGIKDATEFIRQAKEMGESTDLVAVDVGHYEDFKLIQEAAALAAVVAQQARVCDLEENFVDRAETACELIEALATLIASVAGRMECSEGMARIPAGTMDTILAAISEETET